MKGTILKFLVVCSTIWFSGYSVWHVEGAGVSKSKITQIPDGPVSAFGLTWFNGAPVAAFSEKVEARKAKITLVRLSAGGAVLERKDVVTSAAGEILAIKLAPYADKLAMVWEEAFIPPETNKVQALSLDQTLTPGEVRFVGEGKLPRIAGYEKGFGIIWEKLAYFTPSIGGPYELWFKRFVESEDREPETMLLRSDEKGHYADIAASSTEYCINHEFNFSGDSTHWLYASFIAHDKSDVFTRVVDRSGIFGQITKAENNKFNLIVRYPFSISPGVSKSALSSYIFNKEDPVGLTKGIVGLPSKFSHKLIDVDRNNMAWSETDSNVSKFDFMNVGKFDSSGKVTSIVENVTETLMTQLMGGAVADAGDTTHILFQTENEDLFFRAVNWEGSPFLCQFENSENAFAFELWGEPGTYAIEKQDDATGWKHVSNITNTTGSVRFSENISLTSNTFYRARFVP